MRILIVTQYFYPENFRINDFALGMLERGHTVTVLTAKPNYPQGKFFDGYSFFKPFKENYRGIKIFRTPIIPRGNSSGVKLLLNYLSFAVTGSVAAMFIRREFDLIFVFQPSPIFVGIPAIVLKKRLNIPIFFWVQDLWPESVLAASGLRSKLGISILEKVVKLVYQQCNCVLVSSKGFVQSVLTKGIVPSKIAYMPNWAEDLYSAPVTECPERIRTILPNGFKVMFAGNIGEAQDFASLLQAAELTKKYSQIKWVLIGEGRKKEWVEKQVALRNLQNTVFVLGRFPVEEMPSFFSAADALLFSLKDESIFSLTVPSKVQSYMASGKPILAMVNGEGAQIIQEANAGLTCAAGDYAELAKHAIAMFEMNRTDLAQMGQNGSKYFNENFSRDLLLSKLEHLFSSDMLEKQADKNLIIRETLKSN